MAKMRDKVKPVVDKYSKEVGEELVTQAYAEIEKVGSKDKRAHSPESNLIQNE